MVSVKLLKVVARQVLQELDYLHSECHLILCSKLNSLTHLGFVLMNCMIFYLGPPPNDLLRRRVCDTELVR